MKCIRDDVMWGKTLGSGAYISQVVSFHLLCCVASLMVARAMSIVRSGWRRVSSNAEGLGKNRIETEKQQQYWE